MKNILIFSVNNDANALEYALENIESGNRVFFLECDVFLRVCQRNRYGNYFFCKICKKRMNSNIKALGIDKNAELYFLSDIIKNEDIEYASGFQMDFNSVSELKDITYKGACLGFGAFSSYVTFTRNVMPEITDSFKKYIFFLLRKELAVYRALERLQSQYRFDEIIFHNGRFAQYKPFLEFAKMNNIDYISTEFRRVDGKWLRDNFINDIPHSITYVANNVLRNWEMGSPGNRVKIGRSFFEKRKNGLPAGDDNRVYVKNQHLGELPTGWSNDVENIVIFNSSEDEYLAVNRDYDNNLLFPNQFTALKTIFEHYKNDNTKHFYLRIHPNLKDVPFKSHVGLYRLKYPNVTIVPADSSISSYSLLDQSDKVIIFDSTMGVEAEYWGKPVIALTKYFYWPLGMLHHPNTIDEVWDLIDRKDLKAQSTDNIIKYGYWMMVQNYPEFSKVPYKYLHFKAFGREYTDYSIMSLLGSYKLYTLFERGIDKLHCISLFKKLPCTEPYQESNGKV